MQSSNAPSKLTLPFAASGAKNTIPVASQIGITPGAASYTDGFPPLTRTPLSAGGVPPSGQDTNGILYSLSSILRWSSAGAGFPYDSTFAADSNVGGYPAGARVMRSDGTGYWLNTIDNNTTDPENTSAGVAAAAGWVPDIVNGSAAITMTSANVTLTPAQYGKPFITITGTLTANLNLIFPAIYQEWSVVNNTTGAYSITAKTASGTGVILQSGINLIYSNGANVASLVSVPQLQSLSASVASNALTVAYSGGVLDFRSATQASGTPIKSVQVAANSITIPSGATLGTTSGQSSRLVFLVTYNNGAPVLCVANSAGGLQLDESNLISPTTISSGATSAGVIYSASAVAANSPYRVVGAYDVTEVTAGTWATAPSNAVNGGLLALTGMGLGTLLTTNGVAVVRLPGGLILQVAPWTSSASGFSNFSFPITFPNAALFLSFITNSGAGTSPVTNWNKSASTTSYASLATYLPSNGTGVSANLIVFVLGY